MNSLSIFINVQVYYKDSQQACPEENINLFCSCLLKKACHNLLIVYTLLHQDGRNQPLNSLV